MAANDIKVLKENAQGTFDEVVLTPSQLSLGTAATKDAPATGNASSTQVVLGNDSRLSDARTPSLHAASHASGNSDALAAHEINGQTIFDSATVFYSSDQTLSPQRARILTIRNSNSAGITVTLPDEASGTRTGDTYVLVGGSPMSGSVTVRGIANISPLIYQTLATITATGQQFRFRSGGGTSGGWNIVNVDTHEHGASAITSGTLTHERGGLEADVSAYSGLVKISGGATSAVTVTATGESVIGAADAAAARSAIQAAAASHTHPSTDITGLAASATTDTTNASNITSGTLGIARIPTGTTSSTVAIGNHSHELTSLAATGATNGHVLTANGSGGVTFAAASGGGASAMQGIAINFVLN